MEMLLERLHINEFTHNILTKKLRLLLTVKKSIDIEILDVLAYIVARNRNNLKDFHQHYMDSKTLMI